MPNWNRISKLLPVYRGSNHGAGGQHCVMEWVADLNGLGATDKPSCTNQTLRSAAIALNDSTTNFAQRAKLARLIPYLSGFKHMTHEQFLELQSLGLMYLAMPWEEAYTKFAKFLRKHNPRGAERWPLVEKAMAILCKHFPDQAKQACETAKVNQ